MLISNYSHVFFVAIVVGLTGCGGGGGSAGTPSGALPVSVVAAPVLFTTAPASLFTASGAALEFFISGGVAPYTAASNDVSVAVAGINGSKLTIGGVSAGGAVVSIRDAAGATVSSTVTVRGPTSQALFSTIIPNSVISIGSTFAQSYTVGGGAGSYIATSSNVGVAAVSLSGNNVTLTGISAGTAGIVVRDSAGASVSVPVTVQSSNNIALFTTAPASVTVGAGTSASYSVGGGSGPYTATSSNSGVAAVSLSGSVLSVNGLVAGSANVVVKDSAGSSTIISVTVPSVSSTALFTTAPANVSLAIGPNAAQSYLIAGGAGPYSATSSNTTIATVNMSNSNTMKVTGLAAGTSNIVVRDSVGANVIVAVTVISAPTVALYTSAPSSISTAIGTAFSQTYSVGGGVGPYVASSSNSGIASVGLAGSNVTVTGLRVGSANLVVLDSVGSTQTIAVTVLQPSTVLQLLPASLSISELNSNSIDLSIYGGTPPYRGFTSDQKLSSVSVVGSTLTIGLGSNANRCVPATTTSDSSPTFTVIDSLGASATSVMTIVDNGACP